MNATMNMPEVVDDVALGRFVADAFAQRTGGAVTVDRCERRPHEYRSSFYIEELDVRLSNGEALMLICKNVGPAGVLEVARTARPPEMLDGTREIAVYRHLLSRAELRTPVYYGAVADPQLERFWLLLEKVPGSDLARVGDFWAWKAAAEWLARAHQRLPKSASNADLAAVLLRYDEECFEGWIDQAKRALQTPRVTRERLAAPGEIRRMIDRARHVGRLVASWPKTVIHGDFYASNIQIDASGGARRVCPLDWEMAGVGTGLLDLAALTAGKWTNLQKDELAGAYFSAIAQGGRTTTSLTGGLDPTAALRCCELLLAVKWLGRTATWQPPPEHRQDWLAEALRLARTLSTELGAI